MGETGYGQDHLRPRVSPGSCPKGRSVARSRGRRDGQAWRPGPRCAARRGRVARGGCGAAPHPPAQPALDERHIAARRFAPVRRQTVVSSSSCSQRGRSGEVRPLGTTRTQRRSRQPLTLRPSRIECSMQDKPPRNTASFPSTLAPPPPLLPCCPPPPRLPSSFYRHNFNFQSTWERTMSAPAWLYHRHEHRQLCGEVISARPH